MSPAARRCLEVTARAALRALEHAGLPQSPSARQRAGVVLGTTLGERSFPCQSSARRDLPSLEDFLLAPAHRHLATTIAQHLGLNGPVLLNAEACGSGGAALAWAYELITSGHIDLLLAGGADSASSPPASLGNAVTRDSSQVPLDGDGAGVLVLEELEHARARGGRVLAELVGYGVGHHPLGTCAPREDCALAVQQALSTTHTQPESVDCLFPHAVGTHTVLWDALRDILGERIDHMQGKSLAASMLGDTHGATSALDAIAWVLMREHTAATAHPGGDFAARVRTCLDLAPGFGPSFVCVVLRRT